jgi:O-antigen ligase
MDNEMALRLSGPFGDELIIGSYLVFLSIPIISYLYFNYNKKYFFFKNVFVFFSLIIFLTVFLSGERMNFIILFLSYLVFFFVGSNFKKFISATVSMILLVLLIYFNHNSINKRLNEFVYDILNFKNSGHGRLFFSAFSLWENNKIFGVGLKNYRIICNSSKLNEYTGQKENCSTHPHNFYAEILVETGLVGLFLFSLFLLYFFKFILLNLRKIQNKEYNPIIYGSLFIILIYIWPIRSSGSFFSTWNAAFFWFNIGLSLFISRKMTNKVSV